jgi:hypothetical protein
VDGGRFVVTHDAGRRAPFQPVSRSRWRGVEVLSKEVSDIYIGISRPNLDPTGDYHGCSTGGTAPMAGS